MSAPRWRRRPVSRDAITDRLHPVAQATHPAAPQQVQSPTTRRPRTLRLPVVRPVIVRDERDRAAAELLERHLERRPPSQVSLTYALAKRLRLLRVPPPAWTALAGHVHDAVHALEEPHRRAEVALAGPCDDCTAAELCPWHYARLRSWWNARDRVAVTLVDAVTRLTDTVPRPGTP